LETSKRAYLVAAIILTTPLIHAQMTPSRLIETARAAPDLKFPEAAASAFPSAPEMAIYKPSGPGPFPAVVLVHQCHGLRLSALKWQNMSMLTWAKEAVAKGFVVLVLDSLGPRGVDMVCAGAKGGVNFARGTLDAMQAADHLRKFDFVDSDRVSLIGLSWGGIVGLLASSKMWADTLSPGRRFAAAVSLYPKCDPAGPANAGPYNLVNPDIDRPITVLVGEKDIDWPAGECVSRLEPLKASGAPVDWTVYPQATHCWDCESLDGFKAKTPRGESVIHYDRDTTRKSMDQAFEYLSRARSPKASGP
jgi:dienelactone hydrolase